MMFAPDPRRRRKLTADDLIDVYLAGRAGRTLPISPVEYAALSPMERDRFRTAYNAGCDAFLEIRDLETAYAGQGRFKFDKPGEGPCLDSESTRY